MQKAHMGVWCAWEWMAEGKGARQGAEGQFRAGIGGRRVPEQQRDIVHQHLSQAGVLGTPCTPGLCLPSCDTEVRVSTGVSSVPRDRMLGPIGTTRLLLMRKPGRTGNEAIRDRSTVEWATCSSTPGCFPAVCLRLGGLLFQACLGSSRFCWRRRGHAPSFVPSAIGLWC